LSGSFPSLADRRPTSFPTCVSSIFIMLSTWWLELLTFVTLLSMFYNSLAMALNMVMVSLLIFACSSMKSFICIRSGTKFYLARCGSSAHPPSSCSRAAWLPLDNPCGHGHILHTLHMWILLRQPLSLKPLSFLSPSSPTSA
jgi:hypothetical protein